MSTFPTIDPRNCGNYSCSRADAGGDLSSYVIFSFTAAGLRLDQGVERGGAPAGQREEMFQEGGAADGVVQGVVRGAPRGE